MGNSSSTNLKNSIVEASGVSGCWTGGQVYVGECIESYFTGGAKSTQNIKVKSLKVVATKLEGKLHLHHEFLLIEVQQLTGCELPVTIRAEKVYNNKRSEGLSVGGVIKILLADPRSLIEATIKCKFELGECGKIVFKDLFEDLKDHDPSYSIGMNNCWKYAYDASCKVLKRCEELHDTSRETKEAIQQFRETELQKPDLLGESVTSAKFWIFVTVGIVVTAGMIWYLGPPVAYEAATLVEGLGAGITPLELVRTLRTLRPIATVVAKRVFASICGGIGTGTAGSLAECGRYCLRVTGPEFYLMWDCLLRAEQTSSFRM